MDDIYLWFCRKQFLCECVGVQVFQAFERIRSLSRSFALSIAHLHFPLLGVSSWHGMALDRKMHVYSCTCIPNVSYRIVHCLCFYLIFGILPLQKWILEIIHVCTMASHIIAEMVELCKQMDERIHLLPMAMSGACNAHGLQSPLKSICQRIVWRHHRIWCSFRRSLRA